MIWFDKPITGILLFLVLACHVLSYFFHAPLWLTLINGVCHVALFTLLFLCGGSLYDALLVALISTVAGLYECPKPTGNTNVVNGTDKMTETSEGNRHEL